jgi:hypothetical protein
VNLKEAIEEVFGMATEVTGCHDPDVIDAERAWIEVVKKRVLLAIDLRKLRDTVPENPGG